MQRISGQTDRTIENVNLSHAWPSWVTTRNFGLIFLTKLWIWIAIRKLFADDCESASLEAFNNTFLLNPVFLIDNLLNLKDSLINL